MAEGEKRHTVQLASSERIERRKDADIAGGERKRSATSSASDAPEPVASSKRKSSKSSLRSKEDRKSARKSKSKLRATGALKDGADGGAEDCDASDSSESTTPRKERKSEKEREKKEKRRRSKSKKDSSRIDIPLARECESSPNLCSSAPITSEHLRASPESSSMRRSADDQAMGKPMSVAQRQMRKARGDKKERPRSMLYQGALLMAVEDFKGTGPDELTFVKGDMIMFIEKDENGWVRGECNDAVGWFPRKHCQLLPGMKDSKLFDDDQQAGSRGSIIEKKAETKSKLGKFLTLRPSPQDIQERSTILAEDLKSASDPSAAEKADKKKKREYLKRFMSVRGLRQKPSDKASAQVFGSTLEELEAGSSSPIPVLVQQCVAYLQSHSCEKVEGIFRKSGNNNTLTLIKEKYKTPSDEPDLEALCDDPHIIAVLLKQFLGSMSEPVVPSSLYDEFINGFSNAADEAARLAAMRASVAKLPHSSAVVLHFLIEFLVPIAANHEVNLMTPSNLGVVFGPNVFRPLVQTQMTLMDSTSATIIEFLIDHEEEVFAGLEHARDAAVPPKDLAATT